MSETSKTEQPQGGPEKQYPVRSVCAWCNKDLGLADYTSKEPGEITHSICEECKKKYFGEYFKEEKKD